MLTALLNGQRVKAADRIRSAAYICPGSNCGAAVILKIGTRRIPHFAHHPGSSCNLAAESIGHMTAKLDISAEYKSRGYEAEVEVPVPSPLEDRRADILITSPRNRLVRYAIEIQDSLIGEIELWQRTRSYSAAYTRPVWICLLRKEKWTPKQREDGKLTAEKYSPRLHERWIEQWAGEVWFYDWEDKLFWRATFDDHLLWRGGADYIDIGLGEHVQIESYQVASERWVNVVVTGPWRLNQIRISANKKRPIGTLIGYDGEDPGRSEESSGQGRS
jgi:hypothetical protein